jgi:hypothetical protein
VKKRIYSGNVWNLSLANRKNGKLGIIKMPIKLPNPPIYRQFRPAQTINPNGKKQWFTLNSKRWGERPRAPRTA